MENSIHDTVLQPLAPVTTYREVKIGRTLYRVTSVYTGEKELGPTLEKLAAQHVLDEMDGRAKTILQSC